jgi:hypothetical protein
MPLFGLVLIAIDVTLVVHAAKTGRFSPWAYIILMIPIAGQHARRRVGRALNPEKTYRAFKDQVEIADTIANRRALPCARPAARPRRGRRSPTWSNG